MYTNARFTIEPNAMLHVQVVCHSMFLAVTHIGNVEGCWGFPYVLENRKVCRIYEICISCFLIDMKCISKIWEIFFNQMSLFRDPHLHIVLIKHEEIEINKKKRHMDFHKFSKLLITIFTNIVRFSKIFQGFS